MNGRVLLFAWGVSLALSSLAEARKWTDVNGNQINADYVRIHEGEVLLRQGTRLIKCPYDQFSELDKAFIRDQMDAERKKSKRQAGLNQIGGPVASEATDGDARELRTWRDIQGNKVLAQYAGFSLGRVELLKDGQRVSYSYGAFSPTDQAYVSQILIAEGRADEIPKKQQDGEEGDGGGGSHEGNRYGGGSGAMENDYAPPESDYDVASSSSDGGYEPPSHDSSPPIYSPPISHTPAPHSPTMPDMSPPESSFSGPQFETVMVCSNCNRELPDHIGAGDNCPFCHAYLSYEERGDGTKKHAGLLTWRNPALVIRLAVLGFFAVAGLMAALFKR